jgi:hypothetical protein
VLDVVFRNYGSIVRDWDHFPAHTLFGVDFTGDYYGSRKFEYFLAEAVLYEDMCFSYNSAVITTRNAGVGIAPKHQLKAGAFYRRSALLSTFYFVEAYLNGLAFDFLWKLYKEKRDLPEKDRDLLEEWDSKKKQERWVNFRRKMLEYPRIVAGLASPPLTETNCEEVRILLDEAKQRRDFLVHNSPRFHYDLEQHQMEIVSGKLVSLMNLKMDEVTRIVDAAIRLPRRLNEVIGKYRRDLHWLYERNGEGIFPEQVFE